MIHVPSTHVTQLPEIAHSFKWFATMASNVPTILVLLVSVSLRRLLAMTELIAHWTEFVMKQLEAFAQ